MYFFKEIRPLRGLHFQMVLCLCICLGLASCEQPNSDSATGTDSTVDSGTKAKKKIFFGFEYSGFDSIPGGGTSVKDTIQCSLQVSTKDLEGNGPGGIVYNSIDSLHCTIRVSAISEYIIDSLKVDPNVSSPACDAGNLSLGTITFKPDSTSATVPAIILVNDDDCQGSDLVLERGLIVVVEEALPDGPGAVTVENITAWKNGKAVLVEQL